MDFLSLPPRIDRPFTSIDGKLYDSLWVIVCRHSGLKKLIPVNKQTTAKNLVDIFLYDVYPSWGMPEDIVSDRDTRFTSKEWTTFCKENHINQSMSTSHHPETDGQTENANKQVLQVIRAETLEFDHSWVEKLPYIETALNRRKDSARGRTPFEIALGFNVRLYNERKAPTVTTERKNDFQTNQNKLIKSRISQSIQTNKGRRPPPIFQRGDKVLLSTKNLPLATAYKKTAPQYAGPFLITNTYPATDNYRLKLPRQYNRIHPTFHVRLLKPYIENDNKKFPSRKLTRPRPLPEFENEERFQVDRILDRRIDKKGSIDYLVRWTGYGNENTWEPAENIDPGPIEDYEERQERKNPKAIQPKKPTPRSRRYRYAQ
jgi:hypothetical protein